MVCYQCSIEQLHGGNVNIIHFCALHAAAQDMLDMLRSLEDSYFDPLDARGIKKVIAQAEGSPVTEESLL